MEAALAHKAEKAARAAANGHGQTSTSSRWTGRIGTFMQRSTALSVVQEEDATVTQRKEPRKDQKKEQKKGIIQKLRPDMIRRMDDAPKLVNPSGWISDGPAEPLKKAPSAQPSHEPSVAFAEKVAPSLSPSDPFSSRADVPDSETRKKYVQASLKYNLPDDSGNRLLRRLSDPGAYPKPDAPKLRKYRS